MAYRHDDFTGFYCGPPTCVVSSYVVCPQAQYLNNGRQGTTVRQRPGRCGKQSTFSVLAIHIDTTAESRSSWRHPRHNILVKLVQCNLHSTNMARRFEFRQGQEYVRNHFGALSPYTSSLISQFGYSETTYGELRSDRFTSTAGYVTTVLKDVTLTSLIHWSSYYRNQIRVRWNSDFQ